jgi:hypothetical protein
MGSLAESLTEKQRNYPYARFLDHPYQPVVPAEVSAKLKTPMDSAKSLKMENLNVLLDPDYRADDMGYCIQDDGTAYIGQTIPFPDSTREMFQWWFAWHGHEEVRYRIWDPESHKTSRSSLRHIKQRLNPALNWEERFVNTTNFTVHLDGEGRPDTGYMSFLPSDVYGFDMSRYDRKKVSMVCAVNGKADNPFPSFSSLRVLCDCPGGILLRIFFWHGKVVFNGRFIQVPHSLTLETLYPLAVHVGKEYNRLRELLPQLYEENHSIDNRPEEFEPMCV